MGPAAIMRHRGVAAATVILAVAVLALLPAFYSPADGGGTEPVYIDISEAAVLGEDGVYVLEADISGGILVQPDTTAVLDLNGHTVTALSGYGILSDRAYLTIMDSVGTGKVSAKDDAVHAETPYAENRKDWTPTGLIAVESGTFESAEGNAVYCRGMTSMDVSGGTFLAPDGFGIYFWSIGELTISGCSITAESGIAACTVRHHTSIGFESITATGSEEGNHYRHGSGVAL